MVNMDESYYITMLQDYYPVVFKKKRELFRKGFKVYDNIKAINKFKSLGGTIDEIEKNNIIFSKLEDKKFVLKGL